MPKRAKEKKVSLILSGDLLDPPVAEPEAPAPSAEPVAPIGDPQGLPQQPLDFDDDLWIPPRGGDLSAMTKAELQQFAMRNFGQRLPEGPKDRMVSAASQLYRAGPPR